MMVATATAIVTTFNRWKWCRFFWWVTTVKSIWICNDRRWASWVGTMIHLVRLGYGEFDFGFIGGFTCKHTTRHAYSFINICDREVFSYRFSFIEFIFTMPQKNNKNKAKLNVFWHYLICLPSIRFSCDFVYVRCFLFALCMLHS